MWITFDISKSDSIVVVKSQNEASADNHNNAAEKT